MLIIKDAQTDDIDELMDHLRPEDQNEIFAATGNSPKGEIEKALQRNGSKYTARSNEGRIIAIFGVADLNGFSRIGSPWLIGANDIYTHRKAFLKASRAFFPKLVQPYDYLVNMVDARNALSIKWLKWLGFIVHPALPYGPFDMPFHKFEHCPPCLAQKA